MREPFLLVDDWILETVLDGVNLNELCSFNEAFASCLGWVLVDCSCASNSALVGGGIP